MLPVFTRFGRRPAHLYVVLRGCLLLHVVKESLFVSSGPWPFKQTDVTRAVKAVLKLPDPSIARVEITKDGIALILTAAAGQPVPWKRRSRMIGRFLQTTTAHRKSESSRP
jgi:hypothetical protein